MGMYAYLRTRPVEAQPRSGEWLELAASPDQPLLVLKYPSWYAFDREYNFFGDVGFMTPEDEVHYRQITSHLKRRSQGYDAGGISYVCIYMHNYAFRWVRQLIEHVGADKTISLPLGRPELILLMEKAGGIPSVDGEAAIELVRWLCDGFQCGDDRRRNAKPSLARVEVNRKGIWDVQIIITVNREYAGKLIGKGGANIKAIETAVSAMMFGDVRIAVRTA